MVDIIIVAVLVYFLIKMVAHTRAFRMAIGLVAILIFARICQALNLQTLTWILSWLLQASAVLVVILFQPEIRRALEKIGRGRIFSFGRQQSEIADAEYLVGQISRAVLDMAKRKVGAIIVFERRTGLADVYESGTMLSAEISAELIENIFYPNTPLHDGAMIIGDGKIVAAGCFLPLSDNKQIASELGTRHRAALGVSEVSDAYVIVVSEETGSISFAYDGKLMRHLDAKALKATLEQLFMIQQPKSKKAGARDEA